MTWKEVLGAVVVAAIVLTRTGVLRRRGASSRELSRLVLRLAIAVGGVVVVMWMASEVDNGTVRSWSRNAHLMWVAVMMIVGVGALVLGVQSLFAFADPSDGADLSRPMGAYLAAMVVLILGLLGALELERRTGFAFARSSKLLLGIASVAFGVLRPDPLWIFSSRLWGVLGEGGTRALYVLLGLGLASWALFG